MTPPQISADAAVLFSGGADSTLAAARACEQYGSVCLLTCTFSHGFRFSRSQTSVAALQRFYGRDRVQRVFLDTDPLIRALYLHRFSSDLHRYRSYLLFVSYCECCKLAMHTAAIRYCRRNGIERVCEGANHKSAPIFPDQRAAVLADFAGFYGEYGICFTAPVWDIDRADHVLHDMGVIADRDCKNEHVFYSNQHSCLVGLLLHAYGRMALSDRRAEDTARRYFGEKMDVARRLLAEDAGAPAKDAAAALPDGDAGGA